MDRIRLSTSKGSHNSMIGLDQNEDKDYESSVDLDQ